jgi:hypothetical protein
LRECEKGVAQSDTLGGPQETAIISEHGLYRLVMRSRHRPETAECGNGPSPEAPRYAAGMFTVDEPTAEAIRRAFEDGGELSAIVEFKRHFPLITDNAKAGECVRIIAGWQPVPDQPAAEPKRRRKAAKPAAW